MSAAKKKPLTPAQLEIVARLFAALAEPSRLSLLQALQPGPLSVGELMEASGLKQANVSKHLAILYDKRLVKRERDGTTIRSSRTVSKKASGMRRHSTTTRTT